MKAEPIEALKILDETRLNPIHEIPRYKAELAAKIAFQEGQSSPKIKQLEWTDHHLHYFVDTPFGVYHIWKNLNFEENESWTLYFNSYVIDGCIDSDKAQEVAQADYERRIKECLDL